MVDGENKKTKTKIAAFSVQKSPTKVWSSKPTFKLEAIFTYYIHLLKWRLSKIHFHLGQKKTAIKRFFFFSFRMFEWRKSSRKCKGMIQLEMHWWWQSITNFRKRRTRQWKPTLNKQKCYAHVPDNTTSFKHAVGWFFCRWQYWLEVKWLVHRPFLKKEKKKLEQIKLYKIPKNTHRYFYLKGV